MQEPGTQQMMDYTTATYLTIKNIGNVRSSASQQEMRITIKGEAVDFLVTQPVHHIHSKGVPLLKIEEVARDLAP